MSLTTGVATAVHDTPSDCPEPWSTAAITSPGKPLRTSRWTYRLGEIIEGLQYASVDLGPAIKDNKMDAELSRLAAANATITIKVAFKIDEDDDLTVHLRP
jgi:hypothetical protein